MGDTGAADGGGADAGATGAATAGGPTRLGRASGLAGLALGGGAGATEPEPDGGGEGVADVAAGGCSPCACAIDVKNKGATSANEKNDCVPRHRMG
ncbi:MAG TPA: hypothetical protein VKU41_09750 [Polyangiaceae bacterium]|nr:hypothetical protein [Polyangiaceae bacterium]